MSEYTSKEDVLRVICYNCSFSNQGEKCCWDGSTCAKYDAICRIPPADVKPILRAEWVTNNNGWYNCSNCGIEMFFTGVYDENQQYCYFCGADMRERSETNE